MKLFERLRWLAIDSPGQARGGFREQLRAVSVRGRHTRHEKRKVEEVTPVHRQGLQLVLGTVPTIWLRAVSSSTMASTVTVTCGIDACESRASSEDRTRILRSTLSVQSACVLEPLPLALSLVGPDSQIRKPKTSVGVGAVAAVTLVSVCRTVTRAPGTAAPGASSDPSADRSLVHRFLCAIATMRDTPQRAAGKRQYPENSRNLLPMDCCRHTQACGLRGMRGEESERVLHRASRTPARIHNGARYRWGGSGRKGLPSGFSRG